LGAALGGVLVIVSIMLTHTDRHASPQSFNWLTIVALGLGLISGSVQSAEYATHLHIAWAIVLGFGVPLFGEVGLAMATSEYTKAQKRERFRSVSATIENAVADRLEAAISELDPAAIKKHVERTVNALARQAVDSVSAQAAQFYVQSGQQMDVQNAVPNVQGSDLDKVNEQRKAAKLAAQQDMLDAFEADPFASYRSVGQRIGRSPSTVSTWLGELGKAGVVHVNGNGVEVRR
jgi:hypothetical protein